MDSSVFRHRAWTWAWVANILYLWALSFYGWLLDRDALLTLGSVWTLWFAVQEALGWRLNERAKAKGEDEVARTYSQVMQYFAFVDKGSNVWQTLTGWDLFVTMNTIGAGAAAGYIVGQSSHPAFGWFVGLCIAGWNYGHWHNRRRHG